MLTALNTADLVVIMAMTNGSGMKRAAPGLLTGGPLPVRWKVRRVVRPQPRRPWRNAGHRRVAKPGAVRVGGSRRSRDAGPPDPGDPSESAAATRGRSRNTTGQRIGVRRPASQTALGALVR